MSYCREEGTRTPDRSKVARQPDTAISDFKCATAGVFAGFLMEISKQEGHGLQIRAIGSRIANPRHLPIYNKGHGLQVRDISQSLKGHGLQIRDSGLSI